MNATKLLEPNEARSEVYGNISKYLTLAMEEIKSGVRTLVKNPEKLLQKLAAKRVYSPDSKLLPQIKDFTTIKAFDEIYIKNLKSFIHQSQKTLRRLISKKCNKFSRSIEYKNIQIR